MSKRVKKRIVIVLFAIYCVVLGFALFYPGLHHSYSAGRSINFMPFKTISKMISGFANQTISVKTIFNNIVVNILMFVPLGIALPLLFRRTNKFWKVLLICFLTTVFAEIIQYVFHIGAFDVDDIILNTLGGVIGYLIVKIPFIWKRFV